MSGLADTISDVLVSKSMPTNADFGTTGRVPESETRAIFQRELDAGGRNDPRIRADVANRYPDMLSSGFNADDVEAAMSMKPANVPASSKTPTFFESGREIIKNAAMNALPASQVAPAAEIALNQATELGKTIAGGWRGLVSIAKGEGLEAAARHVENPDIFGARMETYEPQSHLAKAGTAALGSEYNPMNLPAVIGKTAGEKVADVTGSPAAGAATETAITAAPLLLLKGGKAPARTEKFVGSGSTVPKPPPGGAASAPKAITEQPNYDIPTYLRKREPVAVEAKSSQVPKTSPAPAVESEPFVEQPIAEEGKALSSTEQQRRAAVLKSVGVDEVRRSAIEGNAKAAATDFQTSKLDNPGGDHMRRVFDQEREALTSHAETIARDTGGTVGTDSQTLEARGHTIVAPLEGFRQWFTDQTSNLYKAARDRAQGTPLTLSKFNDVLGTDSKFQNSDTIALRNGVQARMKELGMIDKEGKTLPATVDQAEALRQYVNEEWSPRSNGRIRELKNALDEDVTSSAGEDVYKQARALHAMKESIFSDPKGISAILDSEGINRKVPIEKVADTITALPNAQFEHIVKTLQNVPPELRPQAQSALAEIKAHFASRVRDAGASRVGQWGARDVTAYLNKNAAKLERIFTPEEMQSFRDLNDAGQILRHDQSYPGAAVQEHNLLERGAMMALPKVGATIGGFLGGGPGAFVGESAGAAAASKIGKSSGLKAAQKRTTRISDFPGSK